MSGGGDFGRAAVRAAIGLGKGATGGAVSPHPPPPSTPAASLLLLAIYSDRRRPSSPPDSPGRNLTTSGHAGKLDAYAMERMALLRTSGRRLLHRCRRPRPFQPAASSAPRRPSSSSFSSRNYSALPGGARLLAAAAPLHCAGRHWPVAVPRLARRLSAPAVSTSPAPVPYDTDDVHEYAAKLGFKKVSEQIIDECKSTAVLYKHKKTGAEVMSVSNDDENKVFGIVFRTPPKNSTGIPHILEHSVLCGSRKYPLKEPFVELLKGSLHTFLNAFTYPDRTCYPVASTNTKDFYNLVDVYLDAVFFPRCVEDFQTFQQEGWHYELDSPEEEISYKALSAHSNGASTFICFLEIASTLRNWRLLCQPARIFSCQQWIAVSDRWRTSSFLSITSSSGSICWRLLFVCVFASYQTISSLRTSLFFAYSSS